jgi:effector-binding domain-containing protein
MGRHGIRPIGPPCGIHLKWDEVAGIFHVAVAAPVRKKIEVEGLEMISLPKSTTYWLDYYGPYEKSSLAHFAMERYFSQNGLTIKAPVIEAYLTDPTQEPNPDKWLTRIYYFTE